MFTAEKAKEVLNVVRPPYTAIFLYGSYARGDAEESSDVDILQITIVHTAPYAVGHFNVTCYTLEQLQRLASKGALFARHLIEEAVPLEDPHGSLEKLKSIYVAPQTYQSVRSQVAGCAPLLDVDEPQFNENAEGFSSLVGYLLRTHLYALAFDKGAQSFAMNHVLGLLDETGARAILSGVRRRSYQAFVPARKFFEQLVGVTCRRTERSLEAFIVNASAHNELAMILGLRLLARGRPFTYDSLHELEP